MPPLLALYEVSIQLARLFAPAEAGDSVAAAASSDVARWH
jgi:hypothetical protein